MTDRWKQERQRVAQTCRRRWHHSRFQTDWEWSRCYDCVTAHNRRRAESNRHQNTLISAEQSTAQHSSLVCNVLLLSALVLWRLAGLFVVPGGRRTQVSPWVLWVPEVQGGDWGQGYLRLGGAIKTLLVSHLYRLSLILLIYEMCIFQFIFQRWIWRRASKNVSSS